MAVKIMFCGAAGTVTGSKYLLTSGKRKILVDAGLFQGDRVWNERNWNSPNFDLKALDCALITHAHLDHIGMLPRFYAQGMRCPIYCTKATLALTEILLLDSGRLQEEEASYRAERKRSRHNPPLPLYTEKDAKDVLGLLQAREFDVDVEVVPGISARWTAMGHILGAACIALELDGKRIVFSGDIGRYQVPILRDPEGVPLGDLLLVESTYGDRLHPNEAIPDELAKIIKTTVERGGVLVVPCFVVGRAQTILFYLRELKESGRIPDVPIVVDSPMARDATDIYVNNPDCYDPEALRLFSRGIQPFLPKDTRFVRDRDESIRLNKVMDPMIILSASGMLTGGRVLHHLRHRISNPLNTILFVGFQPPGSRGAWIKSGAKTMRLLGQEISIRAQIADISGLSAHGDRDELLKWCKSCTGKPTKVAVVHGEPESAESFAALLRKDLGWDVRVAQYLEEWEI